MDLSTVRHIQELRAAEAEVEPFVGKVMGMDSAGSVYRSALRQLGHDVAGIPLEELGKVFQLLKTKTARSSPKKMAADAKAREDFYERFPNANRLNKGSR